MCRNIRTLHNFEPPTTREEIRSAALQYVRKVSGMQKPSRANEAAFEHAVEGLASCHSCAVKRETPHAQRAPGVSFRGSAGRVVAVRVASVLRLRLRRWPI